MRDPKRIDRILSLLEKRWKEHPQLRFFQLLAAIFGPFSTVYEPDFFHREDNITERILQEKEHLGVPFDEEKGL